MGKYKHLWNMGLAFDEERILNKFSDLAREGWILKSTTWLRYKLEKAAPQELIYSMDYKVLKEDKEEYFELFNKGGWNHICSYGGIHFFSASSESVPIYTDEESYLEKYEPVRALYSKGIIFSLLSLGTIGLTKLLLRDNSKWDFIIFLFFAISIMVLTPSLMVTIAYNLKLKKRSNKKSF